jgi:hypothetical protein
MGFFKRKQRQPAEADRLDWKLMERGAIALYHKPQVLAQDAAWLRQHGYRVLELEAGGWSTPAAFHEDAQRVLGFPAHYSRNLMGWVDCLGELDVPDDAGLVLQFRQFDRFAAAQPQLAQTVLDSIESTSRRFLLTGRRFIALVQSDDPRIRFDRVGALPVTWNPREWSDADRGLRGGGIGSGGAGDALA